MNRIRALLVSAMLIFGLGCGSSQPPRVVMVFADISASVHDFAVYRDAFSKVTSPLRPGDRVILAQISDRTYTGFHLCSTRKFLASVTGGTISWSLRNKVRR